MRVDSRSNTVFKGVDLHSKTNNNEHHTNEISVDQLIVRRGQPFILTLTLAQPFNPDLDQLSMKAETGKYPSEPRGTMSRFGVPNKVAPSASAKAVWKAELQKGSSPETGTLTLTITAPADAPIGEYKLSAKHKEEEQVLANLSVLFNPWCSDDWVFQPDEAQRQEYVMNEHGVIYRGNNSYISPCPWDFSQFEEDMVKICLKILDLSVKYKRDPAEDVSARCNPIYVGRIITNMIHNSGNPSGVLQGNWSGDFSGGKSPSYWHSSYTILKQWYSSYYKTVKYGQCWVFASVMCSVMRLLGIPCRVVTNFESAHDADANLTIDTYYTESGREKPSKDSIWNFHVWVEAWMKRPDMDKDGKYDGWQVLDPTPQEESEGMFCCGPAPVKAILKGDVDLKYDIPFVFAEVNADCVSWLIKKDGSKIKLQSDTKKVGQCISTKAVGSNERMDLTNAYKFKEGSKEERDVFVYALSRLTTGAEEMADIMTCTSGRGVAEDAKDEQPSTPSPQLSIRFEEESRPVNGEDVKLTLILSSDSTATRLLSVNTSIQAMRYTGQPAGNIQTEVTEQKLLPGKDLSIPILVPFSTYQRYMVQCRNMTVSTIITDLQSKENRYLAERHISLMDPPISINLTDEGKVNQAMTIELVFMNPVEDTLRNCILTLSGSGLFAEETVVKLQDLQKNRRIRVQFTIVPYRSGRRTLLIDFDCSLFRHIKKSCIINVNA